jgi:cysteine desulfurase
MIYLDNNATTPLCAEAMDAMLPFLRDGWGNPSSQHAAGRQARAAVEAARSAVRELTGAAEDGEIVLTSGGTESDNLAIRGALKARPDKDEAITTRVEHEAVRNLCQVLESEGVRVRWIEVDEDGSIDIDGLKATLSERTAVVSVMTANNETGVLSPIEAIAAIVKERSDALFHTDAVAAAGKVPLRADADGIDLLSISAHKFHGPKGTGALYVRRGAKIEPLFAGGGQENGLRPGTEAVHQIAGMAGAAKTAVDLTAMERVRSMRDRLEKAILEKIANARVNGAGAPRLPNTSNISFEGVNGELLTAMLDAAGIAVSTGSACATGGREPSAVLTAMNVPYSYALGSIRFSLGRSNTEDEIEHVIEVLPEIVSGLRA